MVYEHLRGRTGGCEHGSQNYIRPSGPCPQGDSRSRDTLSVLTLVYPGMTQTLCTAAAALSEQSREQRRVEGYQAKMTTRRGSRLMSSNLWRGQRDNHPTTHMGVWERTPATLRGARSPSLLMAFYVAPVRPCKAHELALARCPGRLACAPTRPPRLEPLFAATSHVWDTAPGRTRHGATGRL